ncbi:MAG TPA: hypothetical protein VHU61_14930 [Solirubrobacteraceae bacterium]|nr:hypothetical protein [Solirubrobacteraceae bacterium]
MPDPREQAMAAARVTYRREFNVNDLLDSGPIGTAAWQSIEAVVDSALDAYAAAEAERAETTPDYQYAHQVSLGLLRPAKTAALDARDLLASIEDSRAEQLKEAVRLIAVVEQSLGEEAS